MTDTDLDKDLVLFEPLTITTDPEAKPLILADVLQALGLSGPKAEAETLIGKTFDIIRARAFPSAYEQQDHAYFCVCLMKDDDQLFTTVLGGVAVVDILDAYAKSGQAIPLRVTLRFTEAGRYRGYYTIE